MFAYNVLYVDIVSYFRINRILQLLYFCVEICKYTNMQYPDWRDICKGVTYSVQKVLGSRPAYYTRDLWPAFNYTVQVHLKKITESN